MIDHEVDDSLGKLVDAVCHFHCVCIQAGRPWWYDGKQAEQADASIRFDVYYGETYKLIWTAYSVPNRMVDKPAGLCYVPVAKTIAIYMPRPAYQIEILGEDVVRLLSARPSSKS